MYLRIHLTAGMQSYFVGIAEYPNPSLLFQLNQSCCVDEVAAQHVDADVMVHYGYACMSQCVCFSLHHNEAATSQL